MEKRIFNFALWLIAACVLAALVSCSPYAASEISTRGIFTPSPSATVTVYSTMERTATPRPSTCTVTAYHLNVRAGAGMRYAVKWILEHGERVTVRRVAGDWLFVTTGETAGYIHSHYCETGE